MYNSGLEIVHRPFTNANGVTVNRSLFITIIANDVIKNVNISGKANVVGTTLPQKLKDVTK